MATAWHALSPGKRKCHSLRGLAESESEEERGEQTEETAQVCACKRGDRR